MIMCEKFLSPRRTKNYDIVYNGIDPNWAGSFIEHEGINIVTSAKWRRFKRLKEIIDLFLGFQKTVPNSIEQFNNTEIKISKKIVTKEEEPQIVLHNFDDDKNDFFDLEKGF